MTRKELLKKLNTVNKKAPKLKNLDSGQDIEKIVKKNTPTSRKPKISKIDEQVKQSKEPQKPTQPEKPLTGKEIKDVKYGEVKKKYFLDLKNDKYIVFEQIPAAKKRGTIVGQVYIGGLGYAIGTYYAMADAKKIVNKKRQALTEAQRTYDYKIKPLSDNIKNAILKALKY